MRIVDVFKSRAGAPADHDVALADERLQSDDLLKQAQEADRAVHEQGICSSDADPVNRTSFLRRAGTPGVAQWFLNHDS